MRRSASSRSDRPTLRRGPIRKGPIRKRRRPSEGEEKHRGDENDDDDDGKTNAGARHPAVNAGLVFVPEFLPVFVHDRGGDGRRTSGADDRQLP